MVPRTAQRVLLFMLLTVLAVGCNKSTPTSPGGGGGGGNGNLTVQSVAVSGTLAVSEGETSQLTASATMSNGSTQDVSNQATWTSSNTMIATVSATGLLTAVATGTADISAVYQGHTGRGTAEVSAARYTLAVTAHSATVLDTCDDFTQGLSHGEFALRVRVTTASGGGLTMTQTANYPGEPGAVSLARNQTLSLGTVRDFDVDGAPGQFIRVLFDATEWDQQFVLIPPSVRNIHDSRMSDRTVSRAHGFDNGSFGPLGSNTLTIGNNSCGIRLNYTVTATKR
jgi:hypothetical protein